MFLPESVTTPLVVTQTQDDTAGSSKQNNDDDIATVLVPAPTTVGSPVVDHYAIAAMTAGSADPDSSVAEGQAYANGQLAYSRKGLERKRLPSLPPYPSSTNFVRGSSKHPLRNYWMNVAPLPVHRNWLERLSISLILLLLTQGRLRWSQASHPKLLTFK
jgi:hypothetical protein